jgi:hypothetical protein
MSKKLYYLIISFIFLSVSISAQDWIYSHPIHFPAEDSNTVRPYYCTLDENSRLWVVSSKALDRNAHNAIYYADKGDTVLTKFIDFDLNGDSDTLSGNVGGIRGIASLNGSIYVSFTVPYPRYAPLTLSGIYRYDNGDTNQVFKIVGSPSPTYGYGSFNHGIDISKDSVVYAGITFGTSVRLFNFSNTLAAQGLSAFGNWIPGDPSNPGANGFSNQMEPGGPQTNGIDLIRDVALMDDGDYTSTETPFYTSRNSLSSDQITGGIAVWQGGKQDFAIDYVPARVIDFNDFLSFIDQIGYGIDIDANGYLWVAGTDSTRKWVKGFALDGINAIGVYDLPSQTSMDIPDENGAPFVAPVDVALNYNAGVAYVVDLYAEKVFVFNNTTVDVKDEKLSLSDFQLEQNYPNPFNPSTIIKFSLNKSDNVRLVVSDMLGREVATLIDEVRSAGNHAVTFNASDLASGVYLYSLVSGDQKITKKMLLMK